MQVAREGSLDVHCDVVEASRGAGSLIEPITVEHQNSWNRVQGRSRRFILSISSLPRALDLVQ